MLNWGIIWIPLVTRIPNVSGNNFWTIMAKDKSFQRSTLQLPLSKTNKMASLKSLEADISVPNGLKKIFVHIWNPCHQRNPNNLPVKHF